MFIQNNYRLLVLLVLPIMLYITLSPCPLLQSSPPVEYGTLTRKQSNAANHSGLFALRGEEKVTPELIKDSVVVSDVEL